MKSLRKASWVFLCGLILSGPIAGAADTANPVSAAEQALQAGNVTLALQELLTVIRDQQAVIQTLDQRTVEQGKAVMSQQESIEVLGRKIADQAEIIARQEEVIAQQRAAIEKGEVARTDILAAVEDIQKAEKLYEVADQTRHTGIFDAPRREKKLYFEKAVEQFRQIAEQYRSSRVAPDAQYQVASIYQRWLGDSKQAAVEFRKVIKEWPDSPVAAQARDALSELGAPLE
jgi:tetratricopeptide (TPR) repeat protein